MGGDNGLPVCGDLPSLIPYRLSGSDMEGVLTYRGSRRRMAAPPTRARCWLWLRRRRDAGAVDRRRGDAPRARHRDTPLTALIEAARQQCYPALSLSVEPDNPARRLYERHRFQVVGTSGGSLTMLLIGLRDGRVFVGLVGERLVVDRV